MSKPVADITHSRRGYRHAIPRMADPDEILAEIVKQIEIHRRESDRSWYTVGEMSKDITKRLGRKPTRARIKRIAKRVRVIAGYDYAERTSETREPSGYRPVECGMFRRGLRERE